MPWQQLTLRLKADELARIEALLRLMGAESIAISDDADTPIFEPAPGTTPLWPELTVRALFDAAIDLLAIARIIGLNESGSFQIEQITDRDWLESVRQTITPIRIGPRLRIVPAEDLEPAADTLALHMGLAFGTGKHPTTRLCLEWLERHPPAALDVPDYGAGTGILALAALKLGARRAYAVDTDLQALDAAQQNAELNGLGNELWIGAPDSLPAQTFDVILANILAEPLIELAASFAAYQPPGAPIALSGILVSQTDAVIDGYANSYEEFARRDSGGWSLVTAV
ncbi:MAG: 50S ribosomal protein L11 methyltransferase [Gammaproteobacteria bacterium]